MATNITAGGKDDKRIEVTEYGPYIVHGDIPLVSKEQVVSEYCEPLTWKKGETLKAGGEYALCRCGQSGDKPFCDGTHYEIGFDGKENADTAPTAERQLVLRGGTQIVVKRDYALCMQSGFCGTRLTTIQQLVRSTDDTQVRSLVMAMVERCPAGALTYSIEPNGPEIEPDLPEQIAATTEYIDEGPIMGPLWLTGRIPVDRADGKPLETRNRVTLCCCGLSRAKPLCDGAHRVMKVRK